MHTRRIADCRPHCVHSCTHSSVAGANDGTRHQRVHFIMHFAMAPDPGGPRRDLRRLPGYRSSLAATRLDQVLSRLGSSAWAIPRSPGSSTTTGSRARPSGSAPLVDSVRTAMRPGGSGLLGRSAGRLGTLQIGSRRGPGRRSTALSGDLLLAPRVHSEASVRWTHSPCSVSCRGYKAVSWRAVSSAATTEAQARWHSQGPRYATLTRRSCPR